MVALVCMHRHKQMKRNSFPTPSKNKTSIHRVFLHRYFRPPHDRQPVFADSRREIIGLANMLTLRARSPSGLTAFTDFFATEFRAKYLGVAITSIVKLCGSLAPDLRAAPPTFIWNLDVFIIGEKCGKNKTSKCQNVRNPRYFVF